MVLTPSAVPDASPKLFLMSRRTTPLSVRAFGPLEPSPGYGPAVSSGTSPAAVESGGRRGRLAGAGTLGRPARRHGEPDPPGHEPEGPSAIDQQGQVVRESAIVIFHGDSIHLSA